MNKREQLQQLMEKVIEANRESRKDAEKLYFKPVQESVLKAIDEYISRCEEVTMYLQCKIMVLSDWEMVVSLLADMMDSTERAVQQHAALPDTIRMHSAYD